MTKNPYIAQKGSQTFGDYPINGYGITIETIKHFLFEINLNNRIGTLDDAPENEVNDILNKFKANKHNFQYYVGLNIDAEYLIYYPTIFDDKTTSPTREVVPTKAELDQTLAKIITMFYDIPASSQKRLITFINKYAYYITDDDFE